MRGIAKHTATRSTYRLVALAVLGLWSYNSGEVCAQSVVPKWGAFELTVLNNRTYANPFDYVEIELQADFTSPSGRTISFYGFHAGDGQGGQTGNVWKLRFMPDEVGDWQYVYTWTDALPGDTGMFTCVDSSLPGQLKPDANRWRFDNGEYTFPVMLPTQQWFKSNVTSHGVGNFISWAKSTVEARIIGITLVYFTHEQAAIPYLKGSAGDIFNVSMWDRLNEHYDMMRDLGMGHYIMFYADDDDSPSFFGITAGSAAEMRLLRYTCARFAAYPIVIWDTGIDIWEYRLPEWNAEFIAIMKSNDPWQHPVSSRNGPHPIPGETYYSDAESRLPDRNLFVQAQSTRGIPTIFTDRWREFFFSPSPNYWTPTRLRQATWEVGLVGGTGVYLGGDENGGYLTNTYATDLESAATIGFASNFINNNVRWFGQLEPHDELLVNATDATLSAVPGEAYIAYLPTGGSVALDLSDASGLLQFDWYNPRTGVTINNAQIDVASGVVQTLTAPDTNDWVMHVYRLLGDIDGSGRVDIKDFAPLQNCLGAKDPFLLTDCPSILAADLNSDSSVDLLDLRILIAQLSMP